MPTPVSRTLTRRAAVRSALALTLHRAAGRRELDGVADQVAEHLAQLGGIAPTVGSVRVEAAFESTRRGRVACLPEGRQRRLQDLVELDLARIERVLAALHLGDVENVVDDGEQMGGGIADEVGVFDDLVRPSELALLVLAEQLGEADHRVERRPELMAHVGDEFGFDLARQLGLDARRVLGPRALCRSTASASSVEYSPISELLVPGAADALNMTRPISPHYPCED